ncbi:ferritin-like domain-containing protein, partial [Kitasatospora paracochleata]
AVARLADLDAASPALARLLASVSASDAAHAAALGDTAPLTPAAAPSASPSASASGTGTGTGTPAGSGGAATPESAKPSPYPSAGAAALQAALGAEHAAVYGYGVVGAFLAAGPQREDGRTSYAAHQARRDAWQRMLAAAGTSPAAAAPGYQLPFQVKDAATAGQLAAHIETQLTAVYADLVAAATGPLRAEAAAALRETALRAVHWGADLPALPGLPSTDGTSPGVSQSASPSA